MENCLTRAAEELRDGFNKVTVRKVNELLGSVIDTGASVRGAYIEATQSHQGILYANDRWKELKSHLPRGKGEIVYAVPGFLTNSMFLNPTNNRMRQMGHDVREWGGLVNLTVTSKTIKNVRDEIYGLFKENNYKPVPSYGHSLGGVLLKAVYEEAQDIMKPPVTMASPFNGVERNDGLVARACKAVNGFSDLMDEVFFHQLAQAAPAEITHLNTRYDGIISPYSCVSLHDEKCENIEMGGGKDRYMITHVNIPFVLETALVLADRLAQPEGEWQPFDETKYQHLQDAGLVHLHKPENMLHNRKPHLVPRPPHIPEDQRIRILWPDSLQVA